MTPKEKAEQLFNRFYFDTLLNELEDAKDCALIAVDEILFIVLKYNDTQPEVTYWKEVKQEIEKL